MGFIHGKSNQLACCGVLLKDGSRCFSLQSLWSEIEQSKIAVGKLRKISRRRSGSMPPCRHAAAMSRRRSCSTWSSIKATKGEITTTSPERTKAGN